MSFNDIDLQWFAAEDEGRTEAPSEHRLRKAREEGRVPKSQELNSSLVLIVTVLVLLFFVIPFAVVVFYSLVDNPTFEATRGETVTATFGFTTSWMNGFVYIEGCNLTERNALVLEVHNRKIFNVLNAVDNNARLYPASSSVRPINAAVFIFVNGVVCIRKFLLNFSPSVAPTQISKPILFFGVLIYINRVQYVEIVFCHLLVLPSVFSKTSFTLPAKVLNFSSLYK